MTQKELLYFEDAIGHEANIISICEDIVSKLENEDLVTFMQNEIQTHQSMQEKLMNLLEEKVNEWSIVNG